jgi:hypothetical protein
MSIKRPVNWALACALAAACSDPAGDPIVGQTQFVSAPPGGDNAKAAGGTDTAGPTPSPSGSTSATPRAVEETDLYRLDGDRLYYLNAYRGLMVFDVADVDHPRLLGRSPIYGTPVEMVVRDGIAVVVVADWFGALDDGTPFHGSVVRGLDASDPSAIRVVGEAKLGGWVRDTRVVGDVLYAVSEDYGWIYGWLPVPAVGIGIGVAGAVGAAPTLIVSSVSFAGGAIQAVGHEEYPGAGGVFNVTPDSILLAHTAGTSARTELLYLDISDPGGAIVPRGALEIDGVVQGWGADNGRWNLDFADGRTAHVVACAGAIWGCSGDGGFVVSTVDFTSPDQPALRGQLDLPAQAWSVAARFVGDRLYLSPQGSWGSGAATPFVVVDVSDPSAPKLAGTTQIPGTVWNLLPGPAAHIFALGNDVQSESGDQVSLAYLDVSAATPRLLGSASFGEGWAWTPAAGTFKAFTMDAQRGLVVLPFSGWSSAKQTYANGLQLVELGAASVATAGAAHTSGWVERGIFVGTRLVALSDLALSVVDYTDHAAPRVTAELTLARNVVAANPQGATIAEVASDFWDYDLSTSEVRVLPLGDAEELGDETAATRVTVDGVDAQVFRNGDLAYLVTSVRTDAPCPGGVTGSCPARRQQIQVVDLAGGGARLRGKVALPVDAWGWGWGWWGFLPWDWYGGAEVVQVGASALAFRRWAPIYVGATKSLDDNSRLYVVDLADPDAPRLASTTITDDPDGWWGNMRVVGDTLYTSHYEWLQKGPMAPWTVRYYVDRIDLHDLAHPRVESKVNVPGLLVGGSASDPSLLYTMDYLWDGNDTKNQLDVVRLHGAQAELLSTTTIPGWVGATVVRNDTAYLSAELWDDHSSTSSMQLHQIDLGNPRRPVDRATTGRSGWGWLLDVEGDRAIVTSGWGPAGVDIYRLVDGQAPRFSQFVRTRGYWTNAVTRQDDTLFLASGNWGVQRIDLK